MTMERIAKASALVGLLPLRSGTVVGAAARHQIGSQVRAGGVPRSRSNLKMTPLRCCVSAPASSCARSRKAKRTQKESHDGYDKPASPTPSVDLQNRQQALLWRLVAACFGQGKKQNLEALSKEIAKESTFLILCSIQWCRSRRLRSAFRNFAKTLKPHFRARCSTMKVQVVSR